ncbi:MAG: hypothetical protein UT86_C0003G0080 [Candidatus Magasanikbacteria bacterium GW2011_GWC2_40_17]|uniref:Tyrosine specific protein phosphatases domain-containing protein n=1 Tax=Candidatus Magasanikbacteria bacterium GW2011_GWA2_42_32 TaxID=1619039 RepID=A0A0G1D4M3_9BACT|nr:MAG: hypothetical protein UT86_C0003G0080 [Candidatus Magasanikbacteria bacterium GW2011_GWC2_40_17]KKS56983.1 MAG: hypothetical protein UV20_C0004G0079 [Candidatus Magasanikbacteria bacterium GW2011_GWA2_42_32]OGH85711.1 MAG: hypothetical protein A2294_03735 [Candidatus Magasanikbacteria bacterium RIFOXYB2_FULL_38_10]
MIEQGGKGGLPTGHGRKGSDQAWDWTEKGFVPASGGSAKKLKIKKDSHPAHRGKKAVQVGPYQIYPGGTRYLKEGDFDGFDVLIPLDDTRAIRLELGQTVQVLGCPWPDFSPPPDGFEEFLLDKVIPLLQAGKKVMVYCIGSHGRTGTFLASLIALLENREQTPDPISAARKRHCHKSVETLEQAEAIFALRGEDLPESYSNDPSLRDYSLGITNYGTGGKSGVYYLEDLADDSFNPPGSSRYGYLDQARLPGGSQGTFGAFGSGTGVKESFPTDKELK